MMEPVQNKQESVNAGPVRALFSGEAYGWGTHPTKLRLAHSTGESIQDHFSEIQTEYKSF